MQKILKDPEYRTLPAGKIHPKGWLKKQLEIQAAGLSGNLDRFWPDIKDSKWIGGGCEGWERVPYWLDGFIPLACLLENQDMKKRADRYINAILERQQEDGWLCPCSREERAGYDMWALFLILKVLVLYHDVTQDPRIEPAVYKALKNLDRHIDGNTLSGWAQMRWYECLIAIFWLYDSREEPWLLDLAVKLKLQGFDFKNLFDHFPYRDAVGKGAWSHMSHGVNLAMSVKSKALEYRMTGDRQELDYADFMLKQLEQYHGMATGMFTADECLSGNSPIQGTELCAVTEMMYSLEKLIEISGRARYGDLLEKIAFNALPASISPDMWTHQYDQQVNQINCMETEKAIFNTNSGESNLFGLEPNFGCCTANFNQGWPKFAASSILQNDSSIYIVSCVPSQIDTDISGVEVCVEVSGEYPFRDRAFITIRTKKKVNFDLKIRIPGFTTNGIIQCGETYAANPESIFTLNREWEGETKITVRFPMQTVLEARPEHMAVVKRGPLLYSLKIEEEWVRVHQDIPGREPPHCDYEVHVKSEWRYGIMGIEKGAEEHPISDIPFSPDSAPVTLNVRCARIDWKQENTYAARLPSSRKALEEPCVKIFIPYGCTNLRMTELPLLENFTFDEVTGDL